MLIITDSHSSIIRDAVQIYLDKKMPYPSEYLSNYKYELFQDHKVNGHNLDILGVMSHTAYNFANHLPPLLETKNYDEYRKVLFLGFNDLLQIWERQHSIQDSIDKYVGSAINLFGKENILIITPTKDHRSNPSLIQTHKDFTEYLIKACEKYGIEHYDIYSIIGEKTEEDLGDAFHYQPKHFIPLLSHLGII